MVTWMAWPGVGRPCSKDQTGGATHFQGVYMSMRWTIRGHEAHKDPCKTSDTLLSLGDLKFLSNNAVKPKALNNDRLTSAVV